MLIFSFNRFMYIIRSDAGQPLRDELARSPQKILVSAFPEFLPKSEATVASVSAPVPSSLVTEGGVSENAPSDDTNVSSITSNTVSDSYFQGLQLMKTLIKLIPGWLPSNSIVFDTLVLLWKSPARISRLRNEQELNLVQVSLNFFWK